MDTVIDRGKLDAFVDGALSPEEAARVVMHLADTPAAQAHVDATMELNALLSAAFEAPMKERVPSRILEVFERFEERRAGARGKVIALRRAVRRSTPYLGGAIAAGVIFSLGLSIWPEPKPDALQLAGPVAAGTTLYEALETRRSGLAIPGERGTEIAVIATFLDDDERPCREFEVVHRGDGMATHGVACRETTRDWIVAFAASRPFAVPGSESEAVGGGTSETEGYLPAAGVTDAAVSGALDALGAGISLDPAREEALIAEGWRRP